MHGRAGVARYGDNMTQVLRNGRGISSDTEWVPMCGANAGAPPANIYIGSTAVGANKTDARGRSLAPSVRAPAQGRLFVNGDTQRSDFALAEVLVWNRALTSAEMLDVQEYFAQRLDDARLYTDQVEDEPPVLSSQVPRRDIVRIDLRTQKSFYKCQVRTSDNVRLVVDGAIFWQVVDVGQMVGATSDPEGDVYSRTRSTLLQAVSNMTFQTFLSDFSQVVAIAMEENRRETFWSERGLYLQSLELTNYEAMDSRTVASLRRIIEQKTERIVRLTMQRSTSEVRSERMRADVALEDNRTALIEAQALNTRLAAETRGATLGGRMARGIAKFIEGMEPVCPDSITDRVGFYEQYVRLEAMDRSTKHLFNGNATVFLKPSTTNLTMELPGARKAQLRSGRT